MDWGYGTDWGFRGVLDIVYSMGRAGGALGTKYFLFIGEHGSSVLLTWIPRRDGCGNMFYDRWRSLVFTVFSILFDTTKLLMLQQFFIYYII
jgi:hypothetical protein